MNQQLETRDQGQNPPAVFPRTIVSRKEHKELKENKGDHNDAKSEEAAP